MQMIGPMNMMRDSSVAFVFIAGSYSGSYLTGYLNATGGVVLGAPPFGTLVKGEDTFDGHPLLGLYDIDLSGKFILSVNRSYNVGLSGMKINGHNATITSNAKNGDTWAYYFGNIAGVPRFYVGQTYEVELI